MLIIGELINGMYKEVARAIEQKDEAVIRRLAKDQTDAGAHMLDVNAGPYTKTPVQDMQWLIKVIQDTVDTGLSIDSTNPDVVEAGLSLAKKRALINSVNADEERLARVLPMVKKYNSMLIGLAMDKKGVPRDRADRLEHAAMIVSVCQTEGVDMRDLYLDPIVFPVNVAQNQAMEVLESLREFSVLSDPPPNTVIGLSNVSQGTKKRSLINTTFLIMAIANGVSAAIVNPLDKNLMDGLITAELFMNKTIYCDSYIDAYKKS